MDIVIPVLILTSLAALVAYSTIKERRRKRRKEDTKEHQPKYAHDPMDLRLKEE